MMFHHGIKLDPSSIADIPFAAYEGKIDDICGWNQTWAALRLLTGLKSSMKKAVRVEDANHYSMFSGKLFVREVSPAIGWFVRDSAAKRGRVFAPAPADKAGKVIEDWHED
jgi:poly-beta-hydroxyalkanoate depolymerase